MERVCSYDQALVLFLDANNKVSGWYSVGIKDEWISQYLNRYLPTTDYPPEISIYQDLKESSDFSFSNIITWDTFPKSDFITNYINMRGLKYSWGFCFFDLNGAYRVVISLDRTRNEMFSEVERSRLQLALPILNNMH